MTARRVAVVALGALALAPATAPAQSAGDEQYRDPFEGSGQREGSGSGSSQSPGRGGSGEAGGASDAQSEGQGAGRGDSSGPATLPRTGVDAWPLAGAGLALLLSGASLRRATRRPARPS